MCGLFFCLEESEIKWDNRINIIIPTQEGLIIKRLKDNFAVLIHSQENLRILALYDINEPFSKEAIKACCYISRHLAEDGSRMFSLDKVYAKTGFGPLIYLIAMDEAGVSGLVPDLEGHKNESSEKVWKEFYLGEGSDWVTVEEFNHPIHEEDYLNSKLTIDFVLPNLAEAKERHVIHSADQLHMISELLFDSCPE